MKYSISLPFGILVSIIAVFAESGIEQSQENIAPVKEETLQISKREVDDGFNRRLQRVQRQFGGNPFARAYLKYFMRNRHQKRERRQVKDYNYYQNYQYNGNNNNNYRTIPLNSRNSFPLKTGYNPVSRTSYSPNYYENNKQRYSQYSERRQTNDKRPVKSDLQRAASQNYRYANKKFKPAPIFFK